jgi:hypothetical protein
MTMHANDRAEFGALLTNVLAYYRQDASRFVLDLWWQACQGFDFEQVRKALTAHAMDPDHGQFAPKVADIVRVLGGTKTDQSQRAWGKALAAASDVGAYSDVAFDDHVIHAVITDMGGWSKFCRLDTKDLSYTQHRFCELYRAYVGTQPDVPRALMGDRSPDAMYAKRGLPLPKPAFVGDKTKAEQLYLLRGDRPSIGQAIAGALGLEASHA